MANVAIACGLSGLVVVDHFFLNLVPELRVGIHRIVVEGLATVLEKLGAKPIPSIDVAAVSDGVAHALSKWAVEAYKEGPTPLLRSKVKIVAAYGALAGSGYAIYTES